MNSNISNDLYRRGLALAKPRVPAFRCEDNLQSNLLTTTQVRKKHPCKVVNGVSLKYKTKTELGKLKPSEMIPNFGGDIPHSDESD